jgi:GNAT superfamily N-acetyltransferase
MDTVTVSFKDYIITTAKDRMVVADVYRWLSEESYWCKGVPYDIFKASFDNSFCIGVIKEGRQIGFARLITDYATFGYLADVYIEEAHRGLGLSKKMMEVLFGLDWVKGLRGVKLQTSDAHDLYRQYGFTECRFPERIMELSRPNIYSQTN